MRPLRALSDEEAARLRGLLFDLDDTLLDHGRLSTDAYSALWRLHRAGFLLVGVTGRPAAWGQLLTRQWPIAGMVTENGAIALHNEQGRIRIYDRATSAEREDRRKRLRSLTDEVRQHWPALQVTDDSFGRLADAAFDIAEARPVAAEVVREAAAFARSRSARVILSAIQMHLSFEIDDKATGTLRFLHRCLGVDPTAARFQMAFIGDSENDASCFAAFHTSIGVKNLRGHFTLTPRYIAAGERGRGFAETADLLLQRCRHLRQDPAP